MKDQTEFVAWWDGNVTPNKARKSDNADRRYQTVAEASESTGISQQQVSKWRRRLKEPGKFLKDIRENNTQLTPSPYLELGGTAIQGVRGPKPSQT